jgi:hypothetical protein
MNAHVKRIVEVSGVSSQCSRGEDHVGIVNLDDTMSELPGVGEGGMSGRNEQRKLGTTRGSLRRSRTAKTSRISRRAVKSRCAHEWGGWGRLSDDGSRQHNSGKSEDPWGSGNPTSWWCTIELTTRHCAGQTVGPRCARRMDANWLTCPRMSGVDLSSCGSQEGPI